MFYGFGPPSTEMSVDDFIRANADPIWLHQNEMWEFMESYDPIDNDD
jgi:hypothetical protein